MSRYDPQTISGYNATPPSDDGSEVSTNQVEWAKHKDKLGDPLKNLAESINTELSAMDGRIYPNGVTTTATSLTLTKAAHDGKNVRASGASTITLPEAATATATFRVIITKTDIGNTLTVDTQGGETINGVANTTLTEQNESVGLVTDATNWFIDTRNLATLPYSRGYVDGLIMSNNGSDAAHDIDISAGSCRDSANGTNIDLSTAITKGINVDWVEGTSQGGFPSGLTIANTTWYHVFVILKDDGTVDGGFDTSLTAVNLLTDATDYTEYRRIGAALTDGSANIIAFLQQPGGYFMWDAPPLDVDDSSSLTTAESRTISTPLGVKVGALLNVLVSRGAGGDDADVYISSPDQADGTPSKTASPLATMAPRIDSNPLIAGGMVGPVWTDTSSQIRTDGSTNLDLLRIATVGYIDPRGKDA